MAEKRLQKVSADSSCFVCGLNNPIGLKADFVIDIDTCSSRASVTLPSNFQGWQDVIHGGVLSALLDEACVYACRTKVDQCVTAELQVRFRKPVPVDATVDVTGRIEDSRRKIWSASAQLKIDGSLYAEAKAKVFILD